MSDGKKTNKKEASKTGLPKRTEEQKLQRRLDERAARKAKRNMSEQDAAVDACVRRIGAPKDREAFRELLSALVANNTIPLKLLSSVPVRVKESGKTRFDQIYDACMFLAFPEYRPIVRDKAFGPAADTSLRYWRALFPKELGISHVVLRAHSFQEAFALGCDYACRLYLRMFRRIPIDMSVRIQFMSDHAACRMLAIRHAVRDATRKTGNLKGKKYSVKDIAGARIAAVGRGDSKNYSIFKYAELRDVRRIRDYRAEVRTSAVDIETFRPKESPSTYDFL